MSLLRFGTCTLLHLVFAAPLLAQDLSTLDAALAAVGRGERLHGRVAKEVGQEAVEAVLRDRGSDLRSLVTVARASGCEGGAARALMERFLEDPLRRTPELQQLRRIEPGIACAAGQQVPGWYDGLRQLQLEKENPPSLVFELLGVHADEQRILAVLEDWDDGLPSTSLSQFFRSLGDSPRPVSVLRGLLRIEDDYPAEGETIDAAVERLARSVECAEFVLEQIDRGVHSPLLVHALGFVPHQLAGEARIRLRRILEGASEATAPRAVTCAANLKMVEALPRVLALAEEQGAAQAAALRALPRLVRLVHGEEEAAEWRRLADEAASGAFDDYSDRPTRAPEVLAAALYCSSALEAQKIARAEDLVSWALDETLPVTLRRAAIRSMPGGEDLSVLAIDALIDLLGDRAVGQDAHRSLRRMAGFRLPPRPGIWRAWLERGLAAGRVRGVSAPAEEPLRSPPLEGTQGAPPPPREASVAEAPTSGPRWLVFGLLLGAVGTLLWRWQEAKSVPMAPCAFKLPSVSEAVQEQRALSVAPTGRTRLERLQAELEIRRRLERGAPEVGDVAVLSQLQAALSELPAGPPASSLGPELLACVEELLVVHAALQGDSTGDDFEACMERLREAEAALGSALGDVREFSFLLAQLAHCRRAGKTFAEEEALRCSELQGSLLAQVRAEAVHGEGGTLDADDVFAAASSGGETRDVDAVFPQEPEKATFETVDADTLFDPPGAG